MKKYNLFFIIVIVYAISIAELNGQNIIENPSFEIINSPVTGSDQVINADFWSNGCGVMHYWRTSYYIANPGTPDLFDKFAQITSQSSCVDQVSILMNKWGTLDERSFENRYVGLSGGLVHDVNGTKFTDYNETVLGTLKEPIEASCKYKVSFYTAAIQGYSMNCFGATPVPKTPNPDYNKIEVVLRVEGDCDIEKVIYQSSNISSFAWQQFSGTFLLTPNEASIGFNKVEFRLTPTPLNYESSVEYSHTVYLDDCSIDKAGSDISDFSIAIAMFGVGSYQVTGFVNTPQSPTEGFEWTVYEVTDATGLVPVSNTFMSNPPNWQQLYSPNTFPGYCCNSNVYSGSGDFYFGHYYKIIREAWDDCSPRSVTSKIIYFSGGGGEDSLMIFPAESELNDFEHNLIFKRNKTRKIHEDRRVLKDKEYGIKISPNPIFDAFKIEILGYDTDELATIEIYNSYGQLVRRSIVLPESNVISVDLSGLSPNIYHLKLEIGNRVEQAKIIKIR